MHLRLVVLMLVVSSFSSMACEMVMGYRTSERLPNIEEAPNNNGLYKDLYTSALANIDCTLKIVRAPKKRIMKMLIEGKVDFYPGLASSRERAPDIYFIKNGLTSKSAIVTRFDHPEIKSLEDVKEKVMLRAFGTNKALTQNHKYIRYVTDLSIAQAVKALSEKKADFFQYDKSAVEYYFAKNPSHNMKIHDSFFRETDVTLGFSKNSIHAQGNPQQPSKMHQFEQALKALKKNNELAQILARYY